MWWLFSFASPALHARMTARTVARTVDSIFSATMATWYHIGITPGCHPRAPCHRRGSTSGRLQPWAVGINLCGYAALTCAVRPRSAAVTAVTAYAVFSIWPAIVAMATANDYRRAQL